MTLILASRRALFLLAAGAFAAGATCARAETVEKAAVAAAKRQAVLIFMRG